MKLKKVKYLLPMTEIDMGGFLVKQAFPTQQIRQIDPFLLLHHADNQFYDDRPARHQGVAPHPHRGFSPVTFVIEGDICHRDSWGHKQIATKGEVQWMHAGKGIVHSERPSEALAAANGRQEIVQLWINTPANKKMIPPEYIYLAAQNIPSFESEDGLVQTKLIAGTYQNKRGKINPQSPMLILWGTAQKGGVQRLDIPQGFNTMLYLIRGEISLKAYGLVEKENLLVLEKEGDSLEVIFKENSEFLLMSGQPINEEIKQYGPYVMNSQTEIMEAIRDYKMGKMGILIED